MNAPHISVVITTYNRPASLSRAVQSVLYQTYENYDLLIVDDASNDETKNLVDKLIDDYSNIVAIRHDINKGLSASRNTGISNARGEYIAFLDDDDEWKPERLEKQVNLINSLASDNKSSLGVVYCGCKVRFLDEKRSVLNLPKIEGNIREYIMNDDLYTIPSTFLFPKIILEELGGFDETLSSSVDHDIWMKLAVHNYKAFFVNEALVVTYETKKKKSMVNETASRICGVEQYLEKWSPTFTNWFGDKGGEQYIRHYRTRVLGNLIGKKFCEGNIVDAYKLFLHIISKNRFSIKELSFQFQLVFREVLKYFLPLKCIDILRKKN